MIAQLALQISQCQRRLLIPSLSSSAHNLSAPKRSIHVNSLFEKVSSFCELLAKEQREVKREKEGDIKESSPGYKFIGEMSPAIITEAILISSQDQSAASSASVSSTPIEVEFANCDCCGLTEECTPAYIERIRERHIGKWICGLCAEAVKDEVVRSEALIGTEEALTRHFNVCKDFRSSHPPPDDPTIHLITAMRQILRRSLISREGWDRRRRARLETEGKPVARLLKGPGAFSLRCLVDWAWIGLG
ncbi:hypothetical protein Nepgr_019413 [Nepenthes gracilis]|uniref:DUF1677 family protein n=1 Tax=Nepenthes gracilis TaxID=150966 RepID=A0AAD3SUZ4_NEPGR|nr:hypothetical protein Nepgr_019413 [Nepenthes gracilis]